MENPSKRWMLGQQWLEFRAAFSPYNAEIFLYTPLYKNKLLSYIVSSSLVVWIPMLWVYGDYKCFNYFSEETVFSDSERFRFWRLKTVPALKGLRCCLYFFTNVYRFRSAWSRNDRIKACKTVPTTYKNRMQLNEERIFTNVFFKLLSRKTKRLRSKCNKYRCKSIENV